MAQQPGPGAGGGWRLAGVSVTGVSHQRAGTPCQDAHLCRELPGGALVAAVADGAGSAARAELGAGVAVRAAVAAVANRLEDALLTEEEDWCRLVGEVLHAAREAVAGAAAAAGHAPADLATTLLLAVATPEWTVAGQVGDGAVVARFGADDFQAVTRPPAQEYINETIFLTSADALDRAQCVARPAGPTGLALFSDGLQMLALKMPQGTPHAPFFVPLLRFLAEARDRSVAEGQLRQFLQSPRVAGRADDDLTLVLAVRAGA